MGTVSERIHKNGVVTYQGKCRRKGKPVTTKTFTDKESAELWCKSVDELWDVEDGKSMPLEFKVDGLSVIDGSSTFAVFDEEWKATLVAALLNSRQGSIEVNKFTPIESSKLTREQMNSSGIYRILAPDGKSYIGSAVEFRKRFRNHKSGIRTGKHTNRLVKLAAASFGIDALRFEVIEFCEKWQLQDREQHYISTMKPKLNLSVSARCSRQKGM